MGAVIIPCGDDIVQRYLALGILLVTLLALGCRGRSSTTTNDGQPKHGVFKSETVQVGKATREYRLVVPETVDLNKPVSLVVAFHGIAIDSKDVMPKYTQLSETAEKHGFIVVYPEAIGKSWGIAPDKVKNDLDFFDALVLKLSGIYKIDPDRIYVVGMSNGGYFAHLVGKERSKTVAAVASHSGPLGLQTVVGINADRKFPVLIVHGDKDQIFSVNTARENRDKYEKEGHEVEYVELKGLGHAWGTKDDINETIWKFFSEHPR